jgi:hypothetical protein
MEKICGLCLSTIRMRRNTMIADSIAVFLFNAIACEGSKNVNENLHAINFGSLVSLKIRWFKSLSRNSGCGFRKLERE